MTYILGIDPGLSTGLAIYNTENQKMMYANIGRYTPLELVQHVERIEGMQEIVVEDFKLRRNQNVDLTPCYLIGALQGAGMDIKLVMPSAHKSIVKDAPLNRLFKEAGYKLGEGHSRDALRLTVYWSAVKLKHTETLNLLREQGK